MYWEGHIGACGLLFVGVDKTWGRGVADPCITVCLVGGGAPGLGGGWVLLVCG